MKSPKILALPALALLALTGCSSSNQAENKPMESVSPIQNQATQAATENLNERGNIEASIGEEIVISGLADNSEVYKFKVTGIELDVQCTEPYSQPAENGHYVKVNLEVNTGSKEAFDENYYHRLYIDGSPFKYIDNNGTTFGGDLYTGRTYGCIAESAKFPYELGPAEKAAGSIILDVPNLNGVIVYKDPQSQGGVEYQISR